MTPPACWIGIDIGTSGSRAVAIDVQGRGLATAAVALPPARSGPNGEVEQAPSDWWRAVRAVLRQLTSQIPGLPTKAISIAGTSATLLMAAPDGTPLGPALMYNDARSKEAARRIAAVAPPTSAALGATSSLAKLLHLSAALPVGTSALALHQADWLLGRLSGLFGLSDWNNALKLGFDPAAEQWPSWLGALDIAPAWLPKVVAPGTAIGPVRPEVAAETGLAADTLIVAGTTDSTAAVIATGVSGPGEAVTCLGSTLVVKILSTVPISDPARGVYSHRLGDLWLAGGASNSGGAVLRRLFDDTTIARLSARMAPEQATGLDYYPLPAPGERFPVRDPYLPPRMAPRPADDRLFLQGLLEGIAAIEADGYRVLRELGAPAPRAIVTIGGGAANPAWTQIRARRLGVPVSAASQQEAAHGAALLARQGAPLSRQ